VCALFNSTEKRLARTLLLLARYGAQGHPQSVLPKVAKDLAAQAGSRRETAKTGSRVVSALHKSVLRAARPVQAPYTFPADFADFR
jgi:hypothetical protein